jgi:hypothetical protein
VTCISCQLRLAFYDPLVNQVDLAMQLVTEKISLTAVGLV